MRVSGICLPSILSTHEYDPFTFITWQLWLGWEGHLHILFISTFISPYTQLKMRINSMRILHIMKTAKNSNIFPMMVYFIRKKKCSKVTEYEIRKLERQRQFSNSRKRSQNQIIYVFCVMCM